MILVLFIGCVSSGKSTDSSHQETIITEYFRGNSVSQWNGQAGEPVKTLIQKTYDTENGTLVEEVYQPEEEYVISLQIQDSNFSGLWETAKGTYDVSGRYLSGEKWHWTEWESTSTVVENPEGCMECLEIGDYIESTDILSDAVLIATKEVFHSDGSSYNVQITETLDVVDEDVFSQELASLQGETP